MGTGSPRLAPTLARSPLTIQGWCMMVYKLGRHVRRSKYAMGVVHVFVVLHAHPPICPHMLPRQGRVGGEAGGERARGKSETKKVGD